MSSLQSLRRIVPKEEQHDDQNHKENKTLKMERDFLKKAAAYFAKVESENSK